MALATATKVYALFGEGDIPAIIALHADNSQCLWMGDKGKQEFDGPGNGFAGFAGGVLSRFADEWPGFALHFDKHEVLIDAGNKCLLKIPATLKEGMTTHFFHYYEVDDDGQVKVFYALDDGGAFALSRVAKA